MTKISILEEMDLQKEAYDLRYDDGVGWQEGAKIINTRHPEITEKYGKPLSHMGFKRGVIAYEKNVMEEKISEGINPLDDLNKKFREEVRKLILRNKKWDDRAEELWEQAKEDGTYSDKARILKQASMNIGQDLKSLTAIQQYGIGQTKIYGDYNEKKEQDIKVLLINYSDALINMRDKLCDECKKKIEFEKLLEDLVKA